MANAGGFARDDTTTTVDFDYDLKKGHAIHRNVDSLLQKSDTLQKKYQRIIALLIVFIILICIGAYILVYNARKKNKLQVVYLIKKYIEMYRKLQKLKDKYKQTFKQRYTL